MLAQLRKVSSSLKFQKFQRSYSSEPLEGIYNPIQVLGKGCVQLIDHMPGKISAPLFCDAAVPEMARISYGAGTKRVSQDKHLIRYLMKHYHTSPFEGVQFKFRLKIPIFVERQLIRHRTAKVNQISGRYSILSDEYYVPENIRIQSANNKQGSAGVLDETDEELSHVATEFRERCENVAGHQYYTDLLEKHDVARELARIVLPQNLFTELYWVMDLHNLLHFLRLRCDPSAQEEIRVVADAIMSVVEKLCPVSTQAFMDYRVNTITLSTHEIEAIRSREVDSNLSQRERQELLGKLRKLKID